MPGRLGNGSRSAIYSILFCSLHISIFEAPYHVELVGRQLHSQTAYLKIQICITQYIRCFLPDPFLKQLQQPR